jgi:predicted esterase
MKKICQDAIALMRKLGPPTLFITMTANPAFPIRLGRQAARILQYLKVPAEWQYYSHAEADGHWIKEPQGYDQMIEFIEKQLRRG